MDTHVTTVIGRSITDRGKIISTIVKGNVALLEQGFVITDETLSEVVVKADNRADMFIREHPVPPVPVSVYKLPSGKYHTYRVSGVLLADLEKF